MILPPPGSVYATNMPAARARSCSALIVGSAATQRGRWPQFSCMKSSRKSAVLLGSTLAGFNVGGGGISIVDHSLTTSAARAGIAPWIDAAIITDAALECSHPIVAGMRPSCSLDQFAGPVRWTKTDQI